MQPISNTFDGHLISYQDLPPKGVIFGESEGMRGLWQIVERVAEASVPILILGEKGTGKEVLARFIHSCNPGSSAPFLKVSPPLNHGHVTDDVVFRVEQVGIGEIKDLASDSSDDHVCTLFVDDVASADPDLQLELLQLIRGNRSFILSDGRDLPVKLRVIAASTCDLEKDVAAGTFRGDFYSFLSVVTLRLTPLRERKEDIPQLADYFWRTYSQRFGCHSDPPTPELIGFLQEHDWPGNVRELENVMKRYVVLGAEGTMEAGQPAYFQNLTASEPAEYRTISLKEVTREAAHALERKIILKTLQETQWNRRQTARVLHISYRALLYKIKEAGLLSEQPKDAAEDSSGDFNRSSDDAALREE